MKKIVHAKHFINKSKKVYKYLSLDLILGFTIRLLSDTHVFLLNYFRLNHRFLKKNDVNQ
jgi:hypothetical protein